MAAGGEIIWSAPGHALGRFQDILVQVRAGEMTDGALDAMETFLRVERVRSQRLEKLGALSVLAPSASPTTGAAAVRQRQLLVGLLADERLFACTVLEGNGLGATVQRTLWRTLLGTKRRGFRGSVREGIRWLTEALGTRLDEAGLLAFVASLRALAERSE